MAKTKEDFLAWLRELPAETVFLEGNGANGGAWRCDVCPIAKFTGKRANYVVYEPGTWQWSFMDAFDRGDFTSLADAIRIAESL